jgi:hypothetical protein
MERGSSKSWQMASVWRESGRKRKKRNEEGFWSSRPNTMDHDIPRKKRKKAKKTAETYQILDNSRVELIQTDSFPAPTHSLEKGTRRILNHGNWSTILL